VVGVLVWSSISFPQAVPGLARLENPAPDSQHSGIGFISGWACDAEEIVIAINGEPFRAGYGMSRTDTEAVCGDADNGFSLLWNWNRLGDGEHTVEAFLDGISFAQSHFTITTFGEEILGDEDKAVFTQAVVQDALDRYDREGRAATLAYHNSLESVDGEWYVFITDENNIMVAQPVQPHLRGQDLTTIVGSDGYALGEEIARATEDGHWIHYLWPNPAAGGAEEPKHTWAIRHAGLIFGSGYYGPPNFQEYELVNFPTAGMTSFVQWSHSLQNFVITEVR
jgi:hypothetical protein